MPGDLRQRERIGDQTGGGVGYFLHTTDFEADFRALKARGVKFLEEPRSERYGRVAVFVDPWGGKWDLIQLTSAMETPREQRAMSFERQILFWTGIFAAMCFALYLLGSTVTPFAAGIVLGYLLDPVVTTLERLGLNRLGASLLILVVFAATFIVALVVVAPILSNQFLVRSASSGLRDTSASARCGGRKRSHREIRGPLAHHSGFGTIVSSDQIQKSVGDFVAQGAQWLINAEVACSPAGLRCSVSCRCSSLRRSSLSTS